MRIIKRLALYCCLPWISLSCHAGDISMSAPPQHGKQIMIYFRQALGGRDAVRVYGLRLEQASMPSSSPAVSVANLRRRELINLEIAPHADFRLEFGRRLIWDVGRHEFGWGSTPTYDPFRLWNGGLSATRACEQQFSCLNLHYH